MKHCSSIPASSRPRIPGAYYQGPRRTPGTTLITMRFEEALCGLYVPGRQTYEWKAALTSAKGNFTLDDT